MNWTDEKVAQLIELDAQGKNTREIAEIMGEGLNRNMILGKLHRIRAKAKGKHGKVSTPPKNTRSPQTSFDLLPHECKWPLKDGTWCCADRLMGAAWPYCERHLLAARRKD